MSNSIDAQPQPLPSKEAVIAVAPNGARKTPRDHPALPLSPQALADTAQACAEAGANMLHLHVRDAEQKHSLDAELYHTALEACQQAVGNRLLLQITTEAVGRYTPEQQVACIKAVKPAAVSIGLREIRPTEQLADARRFAQLNDWMSTHKVLPQYILYDANDVRRYLRLWQSTQLPSAHSILLVLGHYTTGVQAQPAQLLPRLSLLQAAQCPTPWMVCAFGPQERACAATALALGGHVRVGFENNLHLPCGQLARDNAELVRGVSQFLPLLSRPMSRAPHQSLSH